jgi:hypothetical protein
MAAAAAAPPWVSLGPDTTPSGQAARTQATASDKRPVMT